MNMMRMMAFDIGTQEKKRIMWSPSNVVVVTAVSG